MKKIFIFLFFLLSSNAFGAWDIKLKALDNFTTLNPSENFSAKVIQDIKIDDIELSKDDIINCTLNKTIDPKRAKMDAKIYFNLESFENEQGKHDFQIQYLGKYEDEILKEKIKNISAKDAAKSTAGIIGSHYVPGFSQAISFVDGVVENKDDNRVKSGFKQVYKDSPLSFVEKGEEIEIKKGDIFYLKVK